MNSTAIDSTSFEQNYVIALLQSPQDKKYHTRSSKHCYCSDKVTDKVKPFV